jgi:hypothetical protein
MLFFGKKYYTICFKNVPFTIVNIFFFFSPYYKAIRADGHTELSHEIGLELSQRSAAAGLRFELYSGLTEHIHAYFVLLW